MGKYLFDAFGDKLYLIGSLSYQGESGVYSNPVKRKAETPPAGSLNHLLHLTNQEFIFLNLDAAAQQQLWISQPMAARLDGSVIFKADWTNVYDGILFIDTMEASTPAEE